MRNLLLAFLLASQYLSAAAAGISIFPSAPKSLDRVLVHVAAQDLRGEWANADVSLSGGKILVTLHPPAQTSIEVVRAFDWPLGQLPAGAYQLEVVQDAATSTPSTVSIGTTSFVVAPRTSPVEPRADYSDMWWVPTESGWGLSVQQHSSNAVFVVWFVYGADGKSNWYVMPNGQWVGTTYVAGSVYKTTGPYFGGPFNPAMVSVQAAGNAGIGFVTYKRGQFSYTIDGVSGLKEIVRQSF